MSNEKIQEIIGRMVSDAEFRQQLFDNPEAALADYDLSAEEMEAFKNMSDEGFDNLAGDLGDRISRLGLGGFPGGPGSSST